ncbi:hypothetical protein LXL04_007583 [Taraxacum kok-saghyz]
MASLAPMANTLPVAVPAALHYKKKVQPLGHQAADYTHASALRICKDKVEAEDNKDLASNSSITQVIDIVFVRRSMMSLGWNVKNLKPKNKKGLAKSVLDAHQGLIIDHQGLIMSVSDAPFSCSVGAVPLEVTSVTTCIIGPTGTCIAGRGWSCRGPLAVAGSVPLFLAARAI